MAEVVSFGDRLKQRRAELGLSQAQAARELDVARTAYRLWEMEAATPAPDRWRLLSRWLGVSVTAMLLADELISEAEASASQVLEVDFGRSGRDWGTAVLRIRATSFSRVVNSFGMGSRPGLSALSRQAS
jgi:transcriptional regulator with XRE-family HTH domain